MCPLRVLLLCPLRVLLLCPLRVLLLWTLLCPGTGNDQEIFTRTGSDLLIPIRHHLTLNHTDRRRCDRIDWQYQDPTRHYYIKIQEHEGCRLTKSDNIPSPNTRLSENGSLIISNVTPRNDGKYRVDIYNSAVDYILTDDYTIHVEVPVSVPLLHVTCPRNGTAEISCRVEEGTKPNIRLSVIGGSQERYSTSPNHITAIVRSPGPWNITCTVENEVSRSEESRAGVTCPVPVSDPVLDVRCLHNDSAEISCWVENGTDPSIYLTVSGGLEVYNVTSSERTVRVTVPPVSPPHSWNIRCSAKNIIRERSTNQTQDACPGEVWPGIRHLLSPIAVFVLYTVLLIFIVNDLRKMKDEKNRSERKTRRRDQMEMEMEPTYYNDRN
ncbi:uncharacterized protein LOC143981560 isoform X2 [Lithobates pipiens]